MDAASDARDGGQHERRRQHRDDDDEDRVARLADTADDLQPAADLQRAQPEGGRRSEQGGEDRQHVDDLAPTPPFARAPQQWFEGGADQLQTALAVDAVGDRQTDDA